MVVNNFSEAGAIGKIIIESIGSIDAEIEIVARSGPKAEVIYLTTEPGTNIAINLRSDEVQNFTFTYNLGNILIKKVMNWGLITGYVLMLLVYLTLILNPYNKEIEKLFDNFSNGITYLLSKQKQIGYIWQRLNANATAIVTISVLFITSVFFSVFISNPLVYGPSHFVDETRYWDTAFNLYKGTFTTFTYYRSPPFYPISLLPAFYLFSPFSSYLFSKLLNAVYITSAIIPAYLLLQKFTKKNISILAITLLLLNPVHFVMPGLILSESIFYPILTWAVYFAFTNVWPINYKNRVIECLIFGILLGLLFLTRYFALALIPAFLFIWWLKPFETERFPFLFSYKKFLHLIIIFIPLILIIGGWVYMGIAEGLRVKDMLGLFITENPIPDQLSISRLVMWVVFYCSYAILIAAPYLPIFLASLSRFKLKDWKEDSHRWLIALAAIILLSLAVCIRHSWRQNYNYPIPLKLQGRYIFYFGPLFLITIFTSLNMPYKIRNRLKLFIFSSAMISISYAFLFLGMIYLDGPLAISPSSPDGYLIRFMGISFITLTLSNALISSMLINRRKIALFTCMVTFLVGFFTYGNVKILQNILITPTQLLNSQIYHLVKEYNTFSFESNDKNQVPITIFVPTDIAPSQINHLKLTLIFNGYPDIELITSNISKDDPSIIMQAIGKNISLSLRELAERDFLISSNKKYSQYGKYFEFQFESKN